MARRNGPITITAFGDPVLSHKEEMTDAQRNHRQNIRNFLLIATRSELDQEWSMAMAKSDHFRAACIQELIDSL